VSTYLILSPRAAQIKAFGLNRMDIMQRNGNYALPPGTPETLGVEFSGAVAELGEGVTQWKSGDEVIGLALGVSAPSFYGLYYQSRNESADGCGRIGSLRGVHPSPRNQCDVETVPFELGRGREHSRELPHRCVPQTLSLLSTDTTSHTDHSQLTKP
jgi:hypothetical protein